MKKLLMLNGSPKKRKAVSDRLLGLLNEGICDRMLTETIYLYETEFNEALFEKICAADCIVMAQPLYVDCLPAGVIEFMEEISKYVKERSEDLPELYFILNCGFPEDSQNTAAIMILETFCRKTGFYFGGGVAVGSGAMILNSWKAEEVGNLLKKTADRICGEDSDDTEKVYRINVGMAKILFRAKSDKMWIEAGEKKGLTKKDLKKKYY